MNSIRSGRRARGVVVALTLAAVAGCSRREPVLTSPFAGSGAIQPAGVLAVAQLRPAAFLALADVLPAELAEALDGLDEALLFWLDPDACGGHVAALFRGPGAARVVPALAEAGFMEPAAERADAYRLRMPLPGGLPFAVGMARSGSGLLRLFERDGAILLLPTSDLLEVALDLDAATGAETGRGTGADLAVIAVDAPRVGRRLGRLLPYFETVAEVGGGGRGDGAEFGLHAFSAGLMLVQDVCRQIEGVVVQVHGAPTGVTLRLTPEPDSALAGLGEALAPLAGSFPRPAGGMAVLAVIDVAADPAALAAAAGRLASPLLARMEPGPRERFDAGLAALVERAAGRFTVGATAGGDGFAGVEMDENAAAPLLPDVPGLPAGRRAGSWTWYGAEPPVWRSVDAGDAAIRLDGSWGRGTGRFAEGALEVRLEIP